MTPDKYTISETFIKVGDGHALYVQDWGNTAATKPIIFLHGGPGGSVQDKYKATFNPDRERVIFFDQRGCGKSTPYGELTKNTTDKLIEDINKIADHLKIERFIIQGGSWGSCLALAYAIKYPKRVIAMVLCGVYTCSKSENDWMSNGGFQILYPDVWDDYLARTPKQYHNDPSKFHMQQIVTGDAKQKKNSAYAYSCLESGIMSLDDRFTPENYETFDPAGTFIEMAYINNNGFMPDKYILNNSHKITAPVWLVQGRYDIVCPPITAYKLNMTIPKCKLIWVISNHSFEHESWNIVRTILGEIAE